MISADSRTENYTGFVYENGPMSVFSNSNNHQNPGNVFKFEDSSSNHAESPTSDDPDGTNNGESHAESTKNSNPILRYISEILLDEEDDLQQKPCMLHDCLKLQAAEKGFYDAIGRSYPSSPSKIYGGFGDDCHDPDDSNFGRTTSSESNSSSYNTSENSCESDWFNGWGDFESKFLQNSLIESPEIKNSYEVLGLGNSQIRDSHGSVYFQNGTLHNIIPDMLPPITGGGSGRSREKRSHHVDDGTQEGERGNKLSAVYADESEPLEMFDAVLLCQDGKSPAIFCGDRESDSGGSNVKASRSKKGANKGGATNKGGTISTTVDLWSLLTQCAQAVASYDQRSANEILKQIRQNSPASGDGLQRLAKYFADGLESRLAAGTPKYILLQSASAADMLKAYKVYITAIPFQRMSNFLANRTILKLAQNESSLHIIDFGIFYGFQWPCLIQRLSERPGGPPRLRITGIDLPQPGFRPAERVEETGRRLKNYCKRFGVPFEYNCLAQKWETIQLEDLNIDRNEVTVVNCLYRLKNLSDETVTANCPRDAVLRLIRRINPNIFIHGVVNGTYNAPFFLTRFREALFHFSALFDMFEATVPRDNPHRLMFEQGLFGRDAINVIACEGAERVERPETYKQWQVRNRRAGFKQLAIAPELLNRVKGMVKKEYHKDFVVDEDGKWVLQGWKGRILHALSPWVPA
ncbi:scarecrow-like protein 30 [Arachis duranensis]|uniref:Scarecrow-like protein 30 n=1 Tax=Arachis duranensis TaxID=130453 RepID=A0A6P4CIS4_ARADU|nr:scarecrow-like protein 30 [Arachis duranensis]